MKTLLAKIFIPKDNIIVEEIIDVQTLHLFRIKLLMSILLTASVVGLVTGILEWLDILPKDKLYTPVVMLYSVVNFIAYLILKQSQKKSYLFAMHLCIFSSLATFSIMSTSLLYDEFRLIWFFLLSFAAYMLGGKRYGMTISFLILGIIYLQFFTTDLHFSSFALWTFTSSFITFNLFSLIFLDKIERDSHTLQTYLTQEAHKRQTQEKIVEKIHQKDTVNLKNGYLWDSKLKLLTHEGNRVELTQKEQQLLALLITNNNRCVTFEEIQAHLWKDEYEKEISIASVKVQITQLRKKLSKGCIKNIYGCGYILHT